MNSFFTLVNNLKAAGDFLVPYNFPKNDPSLEDDISSLKTITATIDGYEITVYYSKADYSDFILETVQIHSESGPFLPFGVVVKIAKIFLGAEKLSLIEFMRMDKKVYCWTLYRSQYNKPIDPPHDDLKGLKHLQYEGFEYNYLSPAHINFY